MRSNARNVKDKGRGDRTDKGGDEDKRRERKFDKKKYRLQKYSNKYKSMYTVYNATSRLSLQFIYSTHSPLLVNQWEERRKKAVLRGFYKELEKDQQNSAETSLNLNNTSENGDETRYIKNRLGIYDFKI